MLVVPKKWVYQLEVFDNQELPVCVMYVKDFNYAKEVKQKLFAAFPANDGYKIECDLVESSDVGMSPF